MELNEKILKAIQEDLPSATAGELKKFIEESEKQRKELESAKKTNEEAVKLIDDLKEEQKEFWKSRSFKEQGEKALEEAKQKELKLALDFKDEQIKQREFVINKFDGFLSNLVKNPRAIEMISQSGNMPVACNPGTYPQSQPFSSTTNINRSETKD